MKKIVKFPFFITSGKLKFFEHKKTHNFLDLNELIIKMYIIWKFEIVFHKLINYNWKQFCVEISYSFKETI